MKRHILWIENLRTVQVFVVISRLFEYLTFFPISQPWFYDFTYPVSTSANTPGLAHPYHAKQEEMSNFAEDENDDKEENVASTKKNAKKWGWSRHKVGRGLQFPANCKLMGIFTSQFGEALGI